MEMWLHRRSGDKEAFFHSLPFTWNCRAREKKTNTKLFWIFSCFERMALSIFVFGLILRVCVCVSALLSHWKKQIIFLALPKVFAQILCKTQIHTSFHRSFHAMKNGKNGMGKYEMYISLSFSQLVFLYLGLQMYEVMLISFAREKSILQNWYQISFIFPFSFPHSFRYHFERIAQCVCVCVHCTCVELLWIPDLPSEMYFPADEVLKWWKGFLAYPLVSLQFLFSFIFIEKLSHRKLSSIC